MEGGDGQSGGVGDGGGVGALGGGLTRSQTDCEACRPLRRDDRRNSTQPIGSISRWGAPCRWVSPEATAISAARATATARRAMAGRWVLEGWVKR